MLGWELVAVAGVVVAMITTSGPTWLDWLRFAALAVGATIHIQLSKRQEERRRSRKPNVHIDLTAIWSFPAVVVLPIHLVLLLFVVIRAQRWLVARRPLYRYVFASTGMVIAALLVLLLRAGFGPPAWTGIDAMSSIVGFLELISAGLVYGVVPAMLIGGAIVLGSPERALRTVFGTKEDNELEAVTIALGMVAAVLLVTMPAALVIMVVISVVGNRIAEVRQLQVDVRTDPKTGLLNMRGWHEAAERALERSTRSRTPAAVLMIDLDHFKYINDTWGHPAGDDVLEVVATALRNETRPSDVVGRFGGEEFVLLLPDADSAEAVTAGERIRRSIAELEIPTTDKRGGPVAITDRTTSVGIAVYPHHGSELDDLLQIADAAVYEAKENGRDQVRLAARGPSRRAHPAH